MSYTLSTSGNAKVKAGNHANTDLTDDPVLMSALDDMAEGWVCAETRRDWVGSYSSLSTNIKNVLNDIVSSKVALAVITWDSTDYLNSELNSILNHNDGVVTTGLRFLKDFKSNEIKTP